MDGTPATAVVPALIVTHADLADALVRAAERVVGPFEGVTLLSNDQRSRAELETAIAAVRAERDHAIDQIEARSALIDDAAAQVARAEEELRVARITIDEAHLDAESLEEARLIGRLFERGA